MKEIHFVLQGKGGCGKSFIASLIAQYLSKHSTEIQCFDTDPVNQTFSRYAALNVDLVPIMTEHRTIDTSKFDALIETLIEDDGIAVIDNGAATFIPLIQYMTEIDLMSMFEETDIKVYLHVPVCGGQALQDTLSGLGTLINLSKHPKIVVWLNNFQGNINQPGKTFTDFSIYKKHSHRIKVIIDLPNRNPDTFGKDIRSMTEASLTFDEVFCTKQFSLIPRQRLRQVQNDVYLQLNGLHQQLNLID